MPIYFKYNTFARPNWRRVDSPFQDEDEYIMEDVLFIEGRRSDAIEIFLTMFCGYSQRQAS
jgi:hypothetical protein